MFRVGGMGERVEGKMLERWSEGGFIWGFCTYSPGCVIFLYRALSAGTIMFLVWWFAGLGWFRFLGL